jgi:ribosomal protein S18 acetylase RimI-like enzyme
MAKDIKIVHYKAGDYSLLINLWERSGLPYKPKGRDSLESIEKEVELDSNQFLFAILNGKAVGSILVTHDGRKGWINRVAVLPEFRKRGIAKKLIDAAEEWLDSKGIGIYACQIEDYNNESFEVFRKMGYIPFEGIHYLTKRKFPEI